MLFALGYIAGIATCIFILVVLVALQAQRYFAQMIDAIRERAKQLDEKMGGNKLPISRGFVMTPPDDDEFARREIIEENQRQGKSTPISSLRP